MVHLVVVVVLVVVIVVELVVVVVVVVVLVVVDLRSAITAVSWLCNAVTCACNSLFAVSRDSIRVVLAVSAEAFECQ